MKLKSVVHDGCSDILLDALQGKVLQEMVLEKVLKDHLRVTGFGPAEFYTQKCDFACSSEPMCEVRLTGVSVTESRATKDFDLALAELESIYKQIIESLLDPGQKLQLFVSMMLDQAPFGRKSSLLERDPIWVHSKK